MAAAETPNRVTILYDSFGKSPSLTMDWGFAALVEYGGKRILFDTGNNARIFEHNVKALRVDLRNLDFAVISHRHADHTSGITYLLTLNPKVQIYVPDEPWGLFARGVKNDFYRKDPSLPADMRYYGGHPPEILEAGTPWPGGNFIPVSQKTEVVPGVFVLSGVSTTPGTLELTELSLAIKSPQGVILIVGCSHPGVEPILQEATAIDPHINILFGGLHQIQKLDPEVEDRHGTAQPIQARAGGPGTLHRRTGVCCSEEGLWRPLRVCGCGHDYRSSRWRTIGSASLTSSSKTSAYPSPGHSLSS